MLTIIAVAVFLLVCVLISAYASSLPDTERLSIAVQVFVALIAVGSFLIALVALTRF